MKIDSSQNRRSSCDKFRQMMRNILKLSSFPLPKTNARSNSSHSSPYMHQPTVKQPNNQKLQGQNDRHLGGVHGGGSSSFIKIQEIHHDAGSTDDANMYNDMQMNKLHASVTNLKVSDYIKRFHERNKHDSVSLVLPPPPPATTTATPSSR